MTKSIHASTTMAEKSLDAAIVGEIFADHVFSGFERWPQPGEEHLTSSYVREVGGGVAITSCALARLGRRVALFAVAGEEDLWLQRRLQNFGVLLDSLRTTTSPTAVSISISTREDRSFLTWPGTNTELGNYLREPNTRAQLAQARHVHFAMPVERPLAQELFPYLKSAGCTLSLDVGHQQQWLLQPENHATCREVDFFFPNELEGRIMTGLSDPDQVLEALAALGIAGAVLKLGASGAASIASGKIHRAQPPRVHAVDTTGAGDAFDAGFIDALLAGEPLSEQLHRGCLTGAASTRSAGALAGLPSREQLLQLDTKDSRRNV